MERKRARLVVVGAALVALVVAGPGEAAAARKPSSVTRTVKKLRTQVKQLSRQVDAVTQQLNALQGGTATATPTPTPTPTPTGTVSTPAAPAPAPAPQLGTDAVGTNELRARSVTEPKLAFNAIGPNQLQANSVTAPKLAEGSVTGPKLADGSVTFSKLADGAVGPAKIADGSVGGRNLRPIARSTDAVSIDGGGGTGTVGVDCPVGSVLIGGGAGFDFRSGDLADSGPSGNAWFATGENNGTAAQLLHVTALCLPDG